MSKPANKKQDAERRSQKDHARIRWVFRCNAAINNEPDEVTDREAHARFLMNKFEPICSALAFQLESAPTTGYLHYQGCMELSSRMRFAQIQKIFKFEYLAPMIGTPRQAWNYATKLETRVAGPWTWGEPYGEEKVKATEAFVTAVKGGMSDFDLVDHHPGAFMRLDSDKIRMAKKMKPDRIEKYGDKEIEVYVFYGNPGTGKSYAARELYPDIYDVPPQNKGSFFITPDGSEAEVILIEDFDGSMPLKDFNRYIDPYVMRVHVKGKFGWWCPRIVIITTNTLPSQWYDYDTRQDVYAQIKRRIRYCFDFNTPEGKAMTKGITVDELEACYPNAPKRQRSTIGYHSPKAAWQKSFEPIGLVQQPLETEEMKEAKKRKAMALLQAENKRQKIQINYLANAKKQFQWSKTGAPIFEPKRDIEPIMVFDDGTPGDKISFDDDIINSETQPMEEMEDPDTIPKRWF